MLEAAIGPTLSARSSLRRECTGLERQVRQLDKDGQACSLLLTMPSRRSQAIACRAAGTGAVTALTFKPARVTSS